MKYIQKIVGASALLPFIVAGVAQAQATTTPGVPNTGVGGSTGMEITILVASAFIVAAGIGYLLREWRKAV